MSKKILLTSALVFVLAVAGCSSGKKNTQPTPEPVTSSQGVPYDESAYSGTAQIGASPSDAATAAERSLSDNVVYFAYDSSEITAEGDAVVARFASYLQANAASRVRLEGHADERGTREYNVGLGERRAQAVRAALEARGVNANQLSVLSYGEERPADPGHDESAYALNRRVQIIRQ
jgi:peptidoglycan-associated lipoprotein